MTWENRIVARPTVWHDIRFRSRLEARWAAFFHINGWRWAYEPIDFVDWVPDFEIRAACGHSECTPWHRVYVECKPYHRLEQFRGHPCTADMYGDKYGADAVLLAGIDPSVAHMEIVHGSGAGMYTGLQVWEFFNSPDPYSAWLWAGNETQWRPPVDDYC